MATLPETPESAEELRRRLSELKSNSGASWAKLAREAGIPSGTLTTWASGEYGGNDLNVAARVRKFLDGGAVLQRAQAMRVEGPGWLPTPVSTVILGLLQDAHLGDITAFAGTSGCGKSATAAHYRDQAANIFIATMDPTVSSVREMLRVVLRAVGDSEPRYAATSSDISRRIVDRVTGSRALIIIDEAQELCPQALQVARSWNDRCGVGLTFLGDMRLIPLLLASRKLDLATFNSRIDMQDSRSTVGADDIEIVARGWGVEDAASLRFLKSIGDKPGTLRGVVKTIRKAMDLATEEERSLELADLKGVWAQRNIDFAKAR